MAGTLVCPWLTQAYCSDPIQTSLHVYVQVAAALCASYIGGSVNFAAVAQALGLAPGPLLAGAMTAGDADQCMLPMALGASTLPPAPQRALAEKSIPVNAPSVKAPADVRTPAGTESPLRDRRMDMRSSVTMGAPRAFSTLAALTAVAPRLLPPKCPLHPMHCCCWPWPDMACRPTPCLMSPSSCLIYVIPSCPIPPCRQHGHGGVHCCHHEHPSHPGTGGTASSSSLGAADTPCIPCCAQQHCAGSRARSSSSTPWRGEAFTRASARRAPSARSG